MNERMSSPPHVVRGALALELTPGTHPMHAALTQRQAGELSSLIANDLASFVPAVHDLDLVLAATHFDPAEILRAGWPLHQRLQELHARAPLSSTPRIIVFGADQRGVLPQPLRAELELHGGPLRVLPFLLIGAVDMVTAVNAQFERDLLERGMAGAATALLAQTGFGAKIEHARYLTAHDLAAMTALQYEHAGLQRLWPIIEAALFAPQREVWLDASPEPLLRYAQGEARIADFDVDAWRRHDVIEKISADRSSPEIQRRHGYFLARQRQLIAVMQAHGIEVKMLPCSQHEDARSKLASYR